MAAMSETQFLIDMHKWAMQGHMDYLGEVKESANDLVDHVNQFVKAQKANDEATSSTLKRVASPSTGA